MKNLIVFLMVAFAAPAHAGGTLGTDENPIRLTCENLDKTIKSRNAAQNSPVISGTMTVVAQDDTMVPPVILGCPGDHHIVCMMETPSTAKPGDLVHIVGRITQMGDNYVMVDPCGVQTN